MSLRPPDEISKSARERLGLPQRGPDPEEEIKNALEARIKDTTVLDELAGELSEVNPRMDNLQNRMVRLLDRLVGQMDGLEEHMEVEKEEPRQRRVSVSAPAILPQLRNQIAETHARVSNLDELVSRLEELL